MVKSPVLTIVVPVYNAAESIYTIVSSILAQDFRDFELILVDDGSSDNTLVVLREFAKQDSRVVIITKKNGGPSSARNAGLEKARGKFLMFFDADDDISAGALSTLVDEMEKANSDLVVSGWQTNLNLGGRLAKGVERATPDRAQVDSNKQPLKKYIVKSIGNSGELYNLWNKVFRTELIRRHNIRFREDIHFGEDLIFAFHYFQHVHQLNLIPDITYHYQTNSQSSVVRKSALVSDYRRINAEELDKFVGDSRDQELADLTSWVKWRWLLSYWRLVCAAKMPWRNKIGLIKQFSGRELSVAKNGKYIGAKKLVMEKAASSLRRSPMVILATMGIVSLIRKFVTRLKTMGK